jgi:signal transduction histidine kinase
MLLRLFFFIYLQSFACALVIGQGLEKTDFEILVEEIHHLNALNPGRAAGRAASFRGSRGDEEVKADPDKRILLHAALAPHDSLRFGYLEERVRLNRLLGEALEAGDPEHALTEVRLALSDLAFRYGDLRYALRQLIGIFDYRGVGERPGLRLRQLELAVEILNAGGFPARALEVLEEMEALGLDRVPGLRLRWCLHQAEACGLVGDYARQEEMLEQASRLFSGETSPAALATFWIQRTWLALDQIGREEAIRFHGELEALAEQTGSPLLDGEAAIVEAVLACHSTEDLETVRTLLARARAAFEQAVYPARYARLLQMGIEQTRDRPDLEGSACFLEEMAGFRHQENNLTARVNGYAARAAQVAQEHPGSAGRVYELMREHSRYQAHYSQMMHQLREHWTAASRKFKSSTADRSADPHPGGFYFALILLVLLGIVLVLWNRNRIQRHLNRQLEDSVTRARSAELAAEESNRLKSRFLANISHEMKTPMGGIVGMASLLEEVVTDPAQRKYLETIRACSQNLLVLMEDLLDLGRMESGVVEIEPHPLNLRETVRYSMELVRHQAEEKGLSLESHFEEGIPETVIGDGTRIGQVLSNLLTNAIKFTESGDIRVSTGFRKTIGSSGNLTFQVQDTGIGIPEDKTDLIFEPFHRLPERVPSKPVGNGLGLAICRKLAALMGGTISVVSREGEGSTFTVVVPVRI